MKLWLGVSLSLILSNSVMAMSFLPDLYTEQAYLGRESVIQQTTRLRLYENSSPGTRVSPYVTAGSELIMSGIAENPLDSGGSYAYGGVGLRVARGPLGWYNEVRGRGFYRYAPNPQNTHESVDVRSLIVLTHLSETPLVAESAFSFLFEPYMEILYTSADFNNVVSAGWIRTGLRYRLDKAVALDLLAEPFVTYDRVHHFFNNRADVKPTVRLQINGPGLSGSLLVSYLWNTYFARGDFENNPYKNRNEGLRVLAVFGAIF